MANNKEIKMDLEGFTQYDDFVEKFKPKKTTDDCYTPPEVYEAIKDWAVRRYGLEGRQILRPFYPGGDYVHEDYPDGCVVIDNPPFSILSKIEDFYTSHGIDFFLFAPGLSIFKPNFDLGYVICDLAIVYENGATVPTSFVTNMGDNLIETAPDLSKTIKKIQKSDFVQKRYDYPPEILTAARVRYFDGKGVSFSISRKTPTCFVRKIDACDVGIFGGGFMLPQAAAQAAAIKFALSTREQALFEFLSEKEAAVNG